MRKVHEEEAESDSNEDNDVFADNDVDDVDNMHDVENSHKNTNDPDDKIDDEVDRLRGKDNINEDTIPFETKVVHSRMDGEKVGARVTKTSEGMSIEMEQQQPRSGYVRTLFMHIPENDVVVKRFEVIESKLDCKNPSTAEKLHVRFSDIQDAIDYVRSKSSGFENAAMDKVSHTNSRTSATPHGKRKRGQSQIDHEDVKVVDTTGSVGSRGKKQKEQRMVSGRNARNDNVRSSPMKEGYIVEWFADKGYGFIKPDSKNDDNVFVHVSQVIQRTKIARGSIVSFRSSFDKIKKSDTAFDVEVLDRDSRDTTRRYDSPKEHQSRTENIRQRYNEDMVDYQHHHHHANSFHATPTVWQRNPTLSTNNQYDPRRDTEFDEWGVPFHNDCNTAGERVNQQLRREQSYEDNRFNTRQTTGSTDQDSSYVYDRRRRF